MRAVIQRVSQAQVAVGGEVVGAIGSGFVVLVGVAADDTPADVEAVADKIVNLRVMPDDEGKMNRSLIEAGGAALIVSQFTLMGDARRGRRPSFVAAALPDSAEPLYEALCRRVELLGVRVARGRFGAHMMLSLVNDGPVTIQLDSRKLY